MWYELWIEINTRVRVQRKQITWIAWIRVCECKYTIQYVDVQYVHLDTATVQCAQPTSSAYCTTSMCPNIWIRKNVAKKSGKLYTLCAYLRECVCVFVRTFVKSVNINCYQSLMSCDRVIISNRKRLKKAAAAARKHSLYSPFSNTIHTPVTYDL